MAKKLGFMIGPGKASHSWDKALRKYLDRCNMWRHAPCGKQGHTRAYNTYAITTLLFLGQLKTPPGAATDTEALGLLWAFSGPGRNWCRCSDLWHLHDVFGMPLSLE